MKTRSKSNPGQNKKGHTAEVVGNLRDISEADRLKSKLLKKNKELEIIIDSVPAWIFYKDKENRFIHVNKAFCEVMKMTNGQLEGVSCSDLYPKEQAEAFWKDDLDVIATEKPKRNIIEPMKTEQEVLWVKTDKVPYRDVQGNIIGIIGFTLDITESKKAEEELLKNEGRYRSLVTATAHIVWTTNAQGELIGDNPDLRKYTGQSFEQIKGWGWLSTIHSDDQKKTAEAWSKAVETRSIYEIEYRMRRNDGEYRVLHARGVPVIEKNGIIVEWVGTLVDITERKLAEDELQLSRQRLSLHVKNTPLAVVEFSVEGNISGWNLAAENIFGYTRQEAIGKLWTLIVPEKFLIHLDGVWENLVTQKGGNRSSNENVTKGGRLIICEWFNTPLVDNDGKTIGVASLVMDITERTRAEEELKKNKEHLEELVKQRTRKLESEIAVRKLVESELLKAKEAAEKSGTFLNNIINSMGDPVFVKDDQSRILIVNDAFCKIFDMGRHGIIGKTLAEDVTPEERESFLRIDKQVFIDGKENINEELLTVRGAQTRTISTRKTRFSDNNGNKFLVGSIRDISDLKGAEEALQEKIKELDGFFSVNLDLLCIADTDGNFRLLNPAWEKTLGYTTEELMAESFLSFTHPDDVQPTLDAVSTLSSQTKVFGFVNRYRCKDGTYRWLEWQSAPAGKLIYAAARDITDRKLMEERLNKYLTDLKRSNEELEQFAYVASHDLQEPLRMVSSFTQLLEQKYSDKLDKDAHDFIRFAVDGANRMQMLINDLLEFSRVSTKGKEFVKLDASSVLGQAISNLHAKISETGALVTNDDLPFIKGDESQLVRLFQNLIDNAIKFRSESTPIIHISCHDEPEYIKFSVRDNGIGIDHQYFERIFQIFQRLHSKVEYPGTGVGLAICKRIIERHHGKIWLESEVDKGTSFFFTIKK